MINFEVVAVIDCYISEIQQIYEVEFVQHWQKGEGVIATSSVVVLNGIDVRFSQALYGPKNRVKILIDRLSYDRNCIPIFNNFIDKLGLSGILWFETMF